MEIKNFLVRYRRIIIDYINEKSGVIVLKIFSFFLTIFLARILHPNGYGTYTIAMSLAYLIANTLSFGIPVVIVRYLPNLSKKEDKENIISYLLKIQIKADIVAIIILLLLANKLSIVFFKKSTYIILVIIAIFSGIIISLKNSINSIFQSHRRFDIVRNLLSLEGLLKLVVITLLAYLWYTYGAVFGILLVNFLLLVFSLYYVRKLNLKIRTHSTGIQNLNKKELFRYLLILNLSSLGALSYGWIDSLMVSYLLKFEDVAYYRISNAIISSLLWMTSVQFVMAPRISKWSIDTIKKRFSKILTILLVFYSSIMLITIILSPFIVEIVFGSEYLKAVPLVRIFSILLPLNILSLYTATFNLKGYPQYHALISILITISNTVLDYVLIKHTGLVGAIYATIFSWIIGLFVATILFRKKFAK